MFVKVRKYIGFCSYRRSYQLRPPVILLLLLLLQQLLLLLLHRPIVLYYTPDQSPPHVTGHCVLLLLLGLTGRAQTRANAETNSSVVVVWCRGRDAQGALHCAEDPSVRANSDRLSLVSGGGERCRVNSSWYVVLHNMTDCCCWCCCCAAAAVVYEYVSTERCAPR